MTDFHPNIEYEIGSEVWVLDNEDNKPPALIKGIVRKREKKLLKNCTAWSVELPNERDMIKCPYWIMFDNEAAGRKGLRKLLQVLCAN
jgi:hypothetical protein